MLRKSGLRSTPIVKDEVVCVVSLNDALSSERIVRLEDLRGYSLVLPPPGYSDESDEMRRVVRDRYGCPIIPRSAMSEGMLVQMLAVNARNAAIRLSHHMNDYPGMVPIPLEHGGWPPVVGIAASVEARPVVATSWRPPRNSRRSTSESGRRAPLAVDHECIAALPIAAKNAACGRNGG